MIDVRSSRFWAPALVAVLCTGAFVSSELDPVDKAEAPAARSTELLPEARALLGGLKEGDTLVGWTVRSLDGPHEGVVYVQIARDEVEFSLMVTVRGSRAEAPPAMTKYYAIYYGHVQPPKTRLPQGTVRATTHALARRIGENEANLDVPGL